MRFSQDMIYTGKEDKVSKKSGMNYTIVNLLEQDTGKQISCVVEMIDNNLKMLQEVRVAFDLTIGKFVNLKALDVRPIV